MTSKGSFRAHVCLTATTTALLAGTAWGQASASQTHKLKHGETVETLSHRFHVPAKDILAANHIDADDILHDGRRMHIPDAPRKLIVPHSMRRTARIKGDRISVRLGPSSSHHRLKLCDDGTKLTVTGRRDGWLQVSLPDGRSGWVRSDLVAFAKKHRSDDSSASRRSAEEGDSGTASRRHKAGEEGHSALARSSEHSSHSARARHERHLLALAAAKHREASAHRAAHAHNMEVAAAKLHHRRVKALAAARHEERLARIAAEHHGTHHISAAEAHRRQHDENVAHARKLERLHQMALAKRGRHGLSAAAARKHHHDNEALANRLRRHERALARLHRHDNEALANRLRHQARIAACKHHHDNEALANRLRHQARIAARIHRHGGSSGAHERAVAQAQSHENAALTNWLHRLQVKQDWAKRHAENLASSRHAKTHYSHRIRPEAESPSPSNDVVRSAFAYRGTPYRWGSSRPGGFDCSGFTKYIYGRKGVSLPRTAAEQYHAGKAVGHKSMKPGDLVFFHTTRSGISHVGMYVGSGKFVHSSSSGSGGVRVDSLESGYYNKAFRGARRVRKVATEPSGE